MTQLQQVDGKAVAHLAGVRRNRLKWTLGSVAGQVILYVVLLLLGVIFVLPLVWLVSSSLKHESQVFAFPPQFIPRPIVFGNYPEAISKFPFWSSARNTVVITAGVMVGHLLTCSFTAYVFARVRFPFREALFMLVLATLMIPYHVYLIPQYILFRILGWLNSPRPLIIPALLGQSPYYIFLMRQFFRTIPVEYDESARIDGCGRFAVYWRIIVPLSLPVLGVVAIFTFMSTWNDFLGPLIYLNEPRKQTLAIAIRTYAEMKGSHVLEEMKWTDLMAASSLVTLPPMLLFFILQRYFIQGVVITGIKG
jgi:ABC-type glycerol-3-phosphate transport system permease component